jgi:tRNA U55 pseudouridine synthase TruB
VLEVNLQKSVSSTSVSLKATVNLQVYSRTLTRAMGYSMGYPADPHRHWRERIGAVMPERRDTWWSAQTLPEAEQAGEEIAEALTRYGLPALHAVSSTEKLRALWVQRGDHSDYVAALADPQRWQDEQKQRLEAALERYEAKHGR